MTVLDRARASAEASGWRPTGLPGTGVHMVRDGEEEMVLRLGRRGGVTIRYKAQWRHKFRDQFGEVAPEAVGALVRRRRMAA